MNRNSGSSAKNIHLKYSFIQVLRLKEYPNNFCRRTCRQNADILHNQDDYAAIDLVKVQS